jgi:hypothetical protein
MKLKPREQEAIDALKFCIANKRKPFNTDIRIVLRLIEKLRAAQSGDQRE